MLDMKTTGVHTTLGVDMWSFVVLFLRMLSRPFWYSGLYRAKI